MIGSKTISAYGIHFDSALVKVIFRQKTKEGKKLDKKENHPSPWDSTMGLVSKNISLVIDRQLVQPTGERHGAIVPLIGRES